MLKEFKELSMRNNVVDMAVGIIIGAAFGKIVTSLVSDILMPPIHGSTGHKKTPKGPKRSFGGCIRRCRFVRMGLNSLFE